MRKLLLLLLISTNYCHSLVWGEVAENTQHIIKEQYRNIISGDINVVIKPIDSRVKFRSCEIPLSYEIPVTTRLNSRMSVDIICADLKPWRASVPFTLKIIKPVLHSKKPITRNTIIQSDMLQVLPTDITLFANSYYTEKRELIGKLITRSVRAGTAITNNCIKEQVLIKKGEIVQILYLAPGFRVSTNGTALSSGTLNEHIKVKNNRTNKVIEGIVLSKGNVQVRM